MNTKNDIIIDDNHDLKSYNGDFVTGEDIVQRQMLLLATAEAEWKQSPTTGVNTQMYLFSNLEYELRRKIKQQFKRDEIQLTEYENNNNEIKITAEYA